MAEPEQPEVTLPETTGADEEGGPFAPGDTGVTGLAVPDPRPGAPGAGPGEVEPTDNSAGAPVDLERLEAIEDHDR